MSKPQCRAETSDRRSWREFSRHLALAATMADDFLKMSPEERVAALSRPGADRLGPYAGLYLAATLAQAKQAVALLEEAERAWRGARALKPADRGKT